MKTVNSQVLSAALGISRQAVVKRAGAESWKTTEQAVRGGFEKRYIVRHLPEPVRIALAKHTASAVFTTHTPAAIAGAEAGRKLAENRKMEEERELIAIEAQLAAFGEVPPEKQAIAYARKDVLRARDGYLAASGAVNKKQGTAEFCSLFNNGEIRIAEHITRHVKKVSWSTLNRWQKTLEIDGLVGLVPGYRNPKKGTTRLSSEQVDFILAMIHKRPHITIDTLHKTTEARFGNLPGLSVVRRFVNRWKEENPSLYLFISNPDKWRDKYQWAVGSASENVVRLNQVWEFDSTPADIMLADGRYCLIGVIDVFSRRLKLHVSKTSRSTAVAALTRKALLDWGKPEIAKTDNGADYVSHHMVQVFESLGIEQQLCPPFTPEAKPHIERAFKTFAHSFQELMPGYIGHSVADRKDIEARRSFADRIMKRDEHIEISMTAEELQSYCDRWCRAIYHQNRHRSLNNRTPLEVAQAWRETIKTIGNVRALDILLAEAPRNGGERTVAKEGVPVDNITYISDALPEVGTRVRVKIDATDLGTVYLFSLSGEFLCVAQDPLRTGVDRAETAAKLKHRQNQLKREGTKMLNRLVKEQALDEIHEELLAYRESKIDNIISLPPKREEYTTQDLDEAARAVEAFDAISREDAGFDDLLLDTEPDEPPAAISKKEEKVHILRSDSDQYDLIRSQIKKEKRKLTKWEYEWLSNYYQTTNGRMYKALEGDLCEKIGLAERQAEA